MATPKLWLTVTRPLVLEANSSCRPNETTQSTEEKRTKDFLLFVTFRGRSQNILIQELDGGEG